VVVKLTLRKILFWPHLVVGVTGGLIILMLSLTGVLLVFEKPVIRWADTARAVEVPREPRRLPLETLVERARSAQPQAAATAVMVEADPAGAVLVSFGREAGLYVDPYTGATRPLGGGWARTFFHQVTDLHRFLLLEGDHRPVGKGITGAANLLFLFLALTGLYLWFPRKWRWPTWRPVLWFRGGLKGKARDFNWHHVIGFWSLPVLLVVIVSGAVISYGWASDWVYRAAGESPPARQGPGAGPRVTVPPAPEGTPLGTLDAHFAAAAAAVPDHQSITWRIASAPRGAPAGGAQPSGPAGGEGGTTGGRPGQRAAGAPTAVNLMVRRQDVPPQQATVQLALDPFTSAVLANEGYQTATPGRKARIWLRFLHTGEALGGWGQLLAALASLGAGLLVYTGLMLSWRRFLARPRRAPAAAPEIATTPADEPGRMAV